VKLLSAIANGHDGDQRWLAALGGIAPRLRRICPLISA